MLSDRTNLLSMRRQFRTLGICWIIYGVIRLLGAIWLVSFSSTATVMFGALLNRVPNPFAMMSDFHIFYTLTIVLSSLCGVIGILGGLALAAGHSSGRILTLIASFLSLSEIPFGITLGTYSLIVLLPLRDRRVVDMQTSDRPSELRTHPSAI